MNMMNYLKALHIIMNGIRILLEKQVGKIIKCIHHQKHTAKASITQTSL